jgi:hypothetical protein
MPVTSPSTQMRLELIDLLEEEFTSEAFPVVSDRLHPSLGYTETMIGVYPVREAHSTVGNVLEIEVMVQFYAYWEKKVDNFQQADPALIENFAERFRRRLQTANSPGTPHMWFYYIEDITYPPDPTGNITRWEARILGRGNNSEIIETTG